MSTRKNQKKQIDQTDQSKTSNVNITKRKQSSKGSTDRKLVACPGSTESGKQHSDVLSSKIDDDELIDMTQHEDVYTNSYGGLDLQEQTDFDDDSSDTDEIDNHINNHVSDHHNRATGDSNDTDDHVTHDPTVHDRQTHEPSDDLMTEIHADVVSHTKPVDDRSDASDLSNDSLVSTSFDTDHAQGKKRSNGKNEIKITTKSISDVLAHIDTDDINVTRDDTESEIQDDMSGPGIAVSRRKFLVFPNGYLKIVTGCMFSGKTTYIIRECKKWQSIGKHVLMINYALDRRYSDQDKVVSHDKYSVDCMMVDKFTPKLSKKIESYDVILINEGQFFPDLKVNVHHWCDELKKIVVVSGLDGDFMRGKFGEILDLIPDCDDHIKLKAYCSMCKDGTDAVFTWKVKDRPTDCNVVVDIGTDKYVPLCRKHYNQERKKTTTVTKKIN